MAREIGPPHRLRVTAGRLASTLIAMGDLDHARSLLDDALGDARPVTIAARIAWTARLEIALARALAAEQGAAALLWRLDITTCRPVCRATHRTACPNARQTI